ncbi:hypothetical protein GJ744_009559 [Endocarpon pusillum]|uniref:Uncharacterized protein n=1 Tax=Endocarpon pusillum TaxID=364733 RepID=A0A8H7AFR6_9EURO|nr:hypothetical protein GJ744_009559 [Endocarpon pusillum]
MPASESRQNRRESPPKAETSYRGHKNAVDESESRRQSRKRGKNAVQKETITAKDADTTVANEVGDNESANGRASGPSPSRSDFAKSTVLDTLNSAEKVSDSDGYNLAGAWVQPTSFSRTPSTELLEGMTMGVSPPTFGNELERGGFSSKTPPSSPPTRKSRPVSSGAGQYPPQARHSLSERSLHMSQQPFIVSSPPPPHLPQAHFYGLPEIDLGAGIRLREERSDKTTRFLSFIHLDSQSTRRRSNRFKGVLLASDDRCDIVALQKDKLAALGALQGVGGTIVDAKILTWEVGPDPFSNLRPLVSLIVHGPRRRDYAPPPTMDSALDEDRTIIVTPARFNDSTDFQTSVEIYSLATQQHLATLLWSQPNPGLPNIRGLPMSVPPPVGNLKLDARGNFVTVSSGTSGEIFVFGVDRDTARFDCMAKFWTSVQSLQDRRYSNSSNSTEADASPADVNRGGKNTQLPIMSLSSRWLAVVPPGPSACQPLPVTTGPRSSSRTVPGLDSRNAPPRPPVSCTSESPDAESLINRVARGVAQEVVKGARWLGGQGLQTWNNYWNRDQYGNAQSPALNVYHADSHLPAGIFPPTHAPESRPTSAEPQLVSIIDLHMLASESYANNSDTAVATTTFQPPNGVSFLSFSPDGLALISVTRKGDVQYVWDLKQCRHVRAGSLIANPNSEMSTRSPKVTQLAKFARLTPSSIIDIEWRGPTGDQFAVITRNGTVHIFDLPLSAFHWPSRRRSVRLVPSSAPASPAVNAQPDESTTAGSVFSSAMKLASKTQPILANLRGRAPSIGTSIIGGNGNNTISLASATGIRGSKVVAAGLSKSVGAAAGTVSSLRHAGDNRLHLNSLARNPARSHVCWSQYREQSTLLVLDDQCIKSFPVSRSRSSTKPGRQPLSVIDANPKLSLVLPALEQLSSVGATSKTAPESDDDTGQKSVTGYWKLLPPSKPPQRHHIIHPLSFAEIETNAPYQPFHSDRRVNLFIYNDRSAGDTASESHEPWAFGNDIPTIRLNIRPAALSDEEEHNVGASVLYRQTSTTTGESTGGEEGRAEQVVVTTRRRKAKTPRQSMLTARIQSEEDDGFFEDDCDVLDFAEDRV